MLRAQKHYAMKYNQKKLLSTSTPIIQYITQVLLSSSLPFQLKKPEQKKRKPTSLHAHAPKTFLGHYPESCQSPIF
jgi:hypothetical protein